MKSGIMALLIMISFLLIAGRSNCRLIMLNSPMIPTGNPPAFDPHVNSKGLNTANVHVENDAMEYDQERSPSANTVSDENKVSSRISPNVQKTKKIESSVSNKAMGVFNLFPKGPVTPPGLRPTVSVNSIVTKQRLPTSSHMPEVSHMQMIKPKFQTVNVDVRKSRHSNGDDHMQQEKCQKRKLGSSPSPGGGH